MDKEDAAGGRGSEYLPELVVKAVESTLGHLGNREGWIPTMRGPAFRGIPRLISIAMAAPKRLTRNPGARQFVRQEIIRILAYLRADMRITTMIDLARVDPAALDDLLIGRLDKTYEVYRFNIMTSLGIFARHGLINEVLTEERLETVSRNLDKVRGRAATETGKGAVDET